MAFVVIRLVCPAVVAPTHASITTNGAIDVIEIQYEKRSPTRLCDDKVLTRMEPRMATEYAKAAENALPFLKKAAEVTVQ